MQWGKRSDLDRRMGIDTGRGRHCIYSARRLLDICNAVRCGSVGGDCSQLGVVWLLGGCVPIYIYVCCTKFKLRPVG